MLQAIVEGMIEFFPRVFGWAILKGLTLGRYRGFGKDDLLIEGSVGLAALAAIGLLVYRAWTW